MLRDSCVWRECDLDERERPAASRHSFQQILHSTAAGVDKFTEDQSVDSSTGHMT